MPELCRFFGITISMYHDETGKHQKPHIHARYGRNKMSIGIDGEPLAGKMPIKQFRLITSWLVIHEDELYLAWNKAVRKEPLDKIKSLE